MALDGWMDAWMDGWMGGYCEQDRKTWKKRNKTMGDKKDHEIKQERAWSLERQATSASKWSPDMP